ncbi:MAG: hypothetical protein II828_07390 [Clostridia bacterium]|nr:hypothetical protein [Clostridia bacterium]
MTKTLKTLPLALVFALFAMFFPLCRTTGATGNTVYAAAGAANVSLRITAQPSPVTAKDGAPVTFTVKASGEGLTYQWQLSDDQGKSWRNSKATTAAYSTTLTTANNGRYLRCIVSDKYGSSLKSNATYMKITSLAITGQPQPVTAKNGDSVTFTVKAKGPGITYQWQLSDDQGKTWRNSKATTATYSTTLSTSNNGRYLRCIVTDKYGNSLKSDAAYMKITSLAITGQPANVTAKKGTAVSFKITANGPGITYRWQLSDDQGKSWRDSSAKSAQYSATLSDANNGRYLRCVVTDKYGNSLHSKAVYMKISSSGQNGSSGQQGGSTIQSDADGTVWITQNGSKYHTDKNCSRMKNPIKVTVAHAKSLGYTPCKKCS